MSTSQIVEKNQLYSLFIKDYTLYGYHIGDLDDFFFSNCEWYGYSEKSELKEVILLFLQFKTPSLLLLGLSMDLIKIIDNFNRNFPEKFYCHYLREYEPTLRKYFNIKSLGTHQKMSLINHKAENVVNDTNIRILNINYEKIIKEFYDENYPNNYYDNYMLNTGKYLGYFIGDNLVTIAGVHVYSPAYNIAVLGNIATSKKHRKKGLAKATIGKLLANLLNEVKNISLNVQNENLSAIRLYESLGFKKIHEYEEGFLSRIQ